MMLPLAGPRDGSSREAEPGGGQSVIPHPLKLFDDVPYVDSLGLAGKSTLVECALVHAVDWKWWCQSGAPSAPSHPAPGLLLSEKMYNASVLKND